MSTIVFEVVAVLMLIVANGVLAMSEIAVITARQSRLATLARQGDARANGRRIDRVLITPAAAARSGDNHTDRPR